MTTSEFQIANQRASRAFERLLRFLLRYIGTASLLALVAVFMPGDWMAATHLWLGMGELPREPVVGYLARSASLFYALLGGLLWVISFDLRRHRTVLLYLGGAFLFFGVTILGIDYRERMPLFWILTEGPVVTLFGAAVMFLTRKLSRDNSP